ncbi:MAG: hypothetical protein WC340_12080 [Kiritimatiellia bacterium]
MKLNPFIYSLLVMAGLWSGTLRAENEYKWVGGIAGNWSDAANWSNPDGLTGVDYPRTADDKASFLKRTTCEVTLTEDIALTRIFIESYTGSEVGYFYPVTLRGAYRIDAAGTSAAFLLGINRELICDGPEISVANKNLSVYGKLALLSGSVTVDFSSYLVCDRASTMLDIRGGALETQCMLKNCIFSISGGTCRFITTAPDFTGCTAVSFTGGELICAGKHARAELLPATSNAVFRAQSTGIGFSPFETDGLALAFDGAIYVTNAVGSTFAVETNGCLSGDGRLYTSLFTLSNKHTFEADFAGMWLGSGANIGDSSTVNLRHPFTLGAFGDWSSVGTAYWNVTGLLTVDTADPFTTGAHTITLQKFYLQTGAELAVRGGGAFAATLPSYTTASLAFRSLSVEAGSTASFTTPLGYALGAEDFSLGEGATLMIEAGCNANSLELVKSPDIAADATIAVTVASGTVETNIYPVVTGANLSLAHFTLADDAAAAGWQLAKSGSVVYLTKGVAAWTPAGSQYWTGAESGFWSAAANWDSGVNPSGKAVYLGGFANTIVTNDIDDLAITRLETAVGVTGQFTVRGKPFTITTTTTSFGSIPVRASAPLPLVFETAITGGDLFWTAAMNNNYISFAGGLTVSGTMLAAGPTWIGGISSLGQFKADKYRTVGKGQSNGRRAVLRILPGGDVTFEDQNFNQTEYCAVTVMGGGKLTVKGGCYGWRTAGTHGVDGVLDVQAPFSANADQTLTGTGVVSFASAKSDATGSAVLRVGGGVTFALGAWETVSFGAEANTFTIAVEGDATLSGADGGVYGLIAGVTTATTPAARALTVAPQATLVIDVPAGKTFVLDDPLVARGRVIKRGAGVLALGSALNDFTGGFTLEQGTLGLAPSLAQGAARNWTAVGTFPDEIDFLSPDGVKIKVESNTDGTSTLYMKLRAGFLILLR